MSNAAHRVLWTALALLLVAAGGVALALNLGLLPGVEPGDVILGADCAAPGGSPHRGAPSPRQPPVSSPPPAGCGCCGGSCAPPAGRGTAPSPAPVGVDGHAWPPRPWPARWSATSPGIRGSAAPAWC